MQNCKYCGSLPKVEEGSKLIRGYYRHGWWITCSERKSRGCWRMETFARTQKEAIKKWDNKKIKYHIGVDNGKEDMIDKYISMCNKSGYCF